MLKFEKIYSNVNVGENKVIKGMLFIIPNNASIASSGAPEGSSRETEYLERKQLFGEKIANTPFVQIWAHNAPEEGNQSNWTDHGVPSKVLESVGLTTEDFSMPRWRAGLFPHHLPAEWLKEIKEGNHLYMKYTNDSGKEVYIDMICQQKDYRYESHGSFEEVVAKVVAKAGFVLA